MSYNSTSDGTTPDRMLKADVGERDRPVAPANVPDLMRVGQLSANTDMDVETDILDPVTFSQSFCRFRLQNKGILHSNSKITLALKDVSASGVRISPIGVGIHSLIERAVLKIGGKTISEIDDFNHYMGYKSRFISPEHNKEREIVTSARLLARKWSWLNNDAVAVDDAGANDTQTEDFTLDIGRDIQAFKLVYANQNTQPFKWQQHSNAPVFQITINDLFPFLKMNQLPLYMMKEEISIELTFANNNVRCVTANDLGVSSEVYDIDETQCKFVADYIYYPQELMLAYAQANKNMSFTYVDTQLAKRTLTTAAGTDDGVQNLILNVGGAGRIVTKIFQSLATASTTDAHDQLLGNFQSLGTASLANSGVTSLQGTNVHNVRYNDQFLYPVDIDNQARLIHNLEQAEGSVPFIHTEEYGTQDNVGAADGSRLITDTLFMNGRDIGTNLTSKAGYVADRLNRNERVNARGIETYNSFTGFQLKNGNTSVIQRVFLEVLRFASLNDGYIQTAFA